MCGICGIFVPDAVSPIDWQLLNRMNETLRHRGPDDEGYYINHNIGMAMRRLAIIDVAGGQQPIFNEDGSIVVVFNGEIYNFQELWIQLDRFGHHFSTKSDTEVIVHAYEQWGDDALLHLNGMFAISLWDDRRKRLLLARDRMGKKPLYWCYSTNGLLWGSEAKALLASDLVQRKVNPVSLHHYLTLQYTPDPLTIFEGMYQLPAAHKLVIEQGGEPQVSRWWQLKFEPKWEISEGEAIEHARVLLRDAVERRLISEVPLGAFLSGGIDSSIVVALMAEASSKPVKSFSIGFDEHHYSETQYARMIAELYHTDHHEFIFRPADLIQVIEGTVESIDEPFADPAALPLYELSRQTRQYVTVALCGDGGDETLAGYRRYALDGLLEPYSLLPIWITQRFVPIFTQLLPEPSWLPEDRNPITGIKQLAQFSSISFKASLLRWGTYFGRNAKLDLYTDEWRNQLSRLRTEDFLSSVYDDAFAKSLLDCTLYTDQITYLAGDLLPKTDRATMAHSLEGRAPFLDMEWVEWTARLPERYKVRGLQTKWLLRNAFIDKLPASIMQRGKQGFGVPLNGWLQTDLKHWADDLLFGNAALHEWFKPSEIRRLWIEHNSGKHNHSKRLWALLVYSIWLEKYL
jgi:asparagine synthase (glutamine-hydrolysing)